MIEKGEVEKSNTGAVCFVYVYLFIRLRALLVVNTCFELIVVVVLFVCLFSYFFSDEIVVCLAAGLVIGNRQCRAALRIMADVGVAGGSGGSGGEV